MRSTAWLPIALAALLAVPAAGCKGCKDGRPDYSRETPSQTLEAFATALEKGRIPADLDAFFVSPNDLASWKMRCRTRGCKKARFTIVEKKSEDSYTATYLVDFTVWGEGNAVVMKAERAPVEFVYEDGAWFIEQLGEYTRIPLGQKADAGAAAETDAGAAPDDASAAEPK